MTNHETGLRLVENGRSAEALNYLEVALGGAQDLAVPNYADIGATHFVLGGALMQLRDHNRAFEHFETALAIAEQQFPQDDSRVERSRQALEAARSALVRRAM
jgi:hypothetical protein